MDKATNNIQEVSFSEIRSEMEEFKNALPDTGLISDVEMRRMMRRKSNWLSRLVVGEIIALPFITLILFSFAVSYGINIWCMVVYLMFCVADVVLDLRTLRVPKEWIERCSTIELARKLSRQKLQRKRQLIFQAPICVAWVCWVAYEYLKAVMPVTSGAGFLGIWLTMSLVMLVAAFIIIMIIYRKAQATNTAMVANLDALTGDDPAENA